MSFMSVFETFSHHFSLKNDKNCRFFACKLSSDLKNAGFANQKFQKFSTFHSTFFTVKTSTKIQKISSYRPTRTVSSRLQVSFRQSTFGVFLLGMRPISRTGHQRSLQIFLASNSAKEEKVFYI
jgi:hypothetical protein